MGRIKVQALRAGQHPETGELVQMDEVFEIDEKQFVPDAVDKDKRPVYDSWMQKVEQNTPLGVVDIKDDETGGVNSVSKKKFNSSIEAKEAAAQARRRVPATAGAVPGESEGKKNEGKAAVPGAPKPPRSQANQS